ncbi:glycosyltransferase [Marinobacteraceae bacterium S3BR75-40.1]
MELSFIIPTLNEEQGIAQTINRIRDVMDGVSHEIIIVDNGSTDNTRDIASSLADAVFVDSEKTVGGLRNLGASHANGAVLVFNDADVLITKEWLSDLKSTYPKIVSEKIVIGGALDVSDPKNLIHKYWFQPLLNKKKSADVNYVGTGNMVVSKAFFTACKGFDEKLATGEDYDFCIRAKKDEGSIEYHADMKALHEGYPCTFSAFIKREFWHGKGDARSLSAFFSSKVALASFLFVLLHIFIVISLLLHWRSLALVTVVVVVLFAIALSFYRTSARLGLEGRFFHLLLTFGYLYARGSRAIV